MVNFGGFTVAEYQAMDRSVFANVTSKDLVKKMNELDLQKQKLADEEQILRSSIRPESGKAVIDDANYGKLQTVQKQIEDLGPEEC